jgi:hypothetical protein
MQTTGPTPAGAKETGAAAAAATASTPTLQAVTGADVTNDGARKPKGKDKMAKQDRQPDTGLAPRDERSAAREERKRKRPKPEEKTEADKAPTSTNYTTTSDEDISRSGAKATHKKEKKRQEGTTESESRGPEARTEHGVNGLHSLKAKKKRKEEEERKNSEEAKVGMSPLIMFLA